MRRSSSSRFTRASPSRKGIARASPRRPCQDTATKGGLCPVTHGASTPCLSARALDLFHPVALDDVAGAHVLVVLEGHAAFLADLHFLDLVLEALERRE